MVLCADTTFLIHILRGTKAANKALDTIESRGEELSTTFLCIAEVLAGIHGLDPVERANAEGDVLAGLSRFRVLTIEANRVLAFGREYARLDHHLKSNGLDIPDSDKVIIATGCAYGVAEFLTRDSRHFRRVPWITQVEY